MADYADAIIPVSRYSGLSTTRTAGIQEAIDAAITRANTTLQGAIVDIPCGGFNYDVPIRVTGSRVTVRGQGIRKTTLTSTNFFGTHFYVGPPMSMPLGPNLTTTVNANLRSMNFTGAANPWCISLRDHPGGELYGKTTFTIEFYYQPVTVGGGFAAICSSGAERLRGEGFNRSFFIIQNGNVLNVSLTTTAGTASLASVATMVAGTRKHIAFVWDGTTARLFVEGVQQASGALGGTYQPPAYEDFVLGYTPNWFPLAGVIFNQIDGYIQCFRISSTARYTSNFTAPTANFGADGNTLVYIAPANAFPSPIGSLDPFTLVESPLGTGYALFRPALALDNPLYGGINYSGIEGITFGAHTAGATIGPNIRTLVNGRFKDISIANSRAGMEFQENCYQLLVENYYATPLPFPGLGGVGGCRFGLNNAGPVAGIVYWEQIHITGSAYGFYWGNGGGGIVNDMFIEMDEQTVWAFTLNDELGGNSVYTVNQLVINDENGGFAHDHMITISATRSVIFIGGLFDGALAGGANSAVYYNNAGRATFSGCDIKSFINPLFALSAATVAAKASVPEPSLILINLQNVAGTAVYLAANAWFFQEMPGPLTDKIATLRNWNDPTKQIRDNLDGLSPGATRIVTWQDADQIPASINLAQTWTAIQTLGSGLLRATSPRLVTSILDTNGNEWLIITATASAVNELTVANAATANNPSITPSGNDTDIGLNLIMKGAGVLGVTGPEVITAAVANALAVGRQGATNPGLNVDASASSCVTGFNIASLAAGSGAGMTVTSSGTNESAAINAKGTGEIQFQSNRANVSSTGKVKARAGNGASPTTATITLAGPLYVNTSVVGNVGGGEDDLHSTTIEANTFAEDGDSANFVVAGNWTAGASTRTTRLYYAGTLIVALASASTDQKWIIKGTMIRVDATNMRFAFEAHLSPAAGTSPTQFFAREATVSATHSSGNIFKCTGESSGATNNDITQTVTKIEKGSAP